LDIGMEMVRTYALTYFLIGKFPIRKLCRIDYLSKEVRPAL